MRDSLITDESDVFSFGMVIIEVGVDCPSYTNCLIHCLRFSLGILRSVKRQGLSGGESQKGIVQDGQITLISPNHYGC